MSTWHKKISQSLADSVSAVLQDMKEDQKNSQNKMMKKGKGEPISKPNQNLPEEDKEENGNGKNGKNGKKLDAVDPKAVKKKFADRKDKDIDNDGDTDGSDKFLHKKRKAISKAIRNTSADKKKIKLTKKKEKVTVNPSAKDEQFADERAQLRETLEASFDKVFQYSNKEEEAYRDQWMYEFDAHVNEVDSQAYIDPLQRKVYYIEGLTSKAAANRYLSHCIANASMAGGQYVKAGTRGGDSTMSAKQQGQGADTNVVPPIFQVKH